MPRTMNLEQRELVSAAADILGVDLKVYNNEIKGYSNLPQELFEGFYFDVPLTVLSGRVTYSGIQPTVVVDLDIRGHLSAVLLVEGVKGSPELTATLHLYNNAVAPYVVSFPKSFSRIAMYKTIEPMLLRTFIMSTVRKVEWRTAPDNCVSSFLELREEGVASYMARQESGLC